MASLIYKSSEVFRIFLSCDYTVSSRQAKKFLSIFFRYEIPTSEQNTTITKCVFNKKIICVFC